MMPSHQAVVLVKVLCNFRNQYWGDDPRGLPSKYHPSLVSAITSKLLCGTRSETTLYISHSLERGHISTRKQDMTLSPSDVGFGTSDRAGAVPSGQFCTIFNWSPFLNESWNFHAVFLCPRFRPSQQSRLRFITLALKIGLKEGTQTASLQVRRKKKSNNDTHSFVACFKVLSAVDPVNTGRVFLSQAATQGGQ